MNVPDQALYIGHPFAFDCFVDGAQEEDQFAIVFARTATGAPIELAWTGSADPDGRLRIRFDGNATASLAPGTFKAELAMQRGTMRGILGVLLVVPVQNALTPPNANAPDPLVDSVGQPLCITIATQPAIPVRLVAGLKGDTGNDGLPPNLPDLSLVFEGALL